MSRQAKQSASPKPPSWLARAAIFSYANRRKAATAAAVALTLTLGYHVVFGQNGLVVLDQKRQMSRALDAQINDLKKENGQLKDHVDRLNDDPNAIEHEAREQLHYTRPGEVIYTLPAAPAPTTPSAKK